MGWKSIQEAYAEKSQKWRFLVVREGPGSVTPMMIPMAEVHTPKESAWDLLKCCIDFSKCQAHLLTKK